MDYPEYKKLMGQLRVGKNLPDATYLHESAMAAVPQELHAFLFRTIEKLDLASAPWNIVKFFKKDFKISLLYYPSFFENSYPALHTSYTIDLEKNIVRTSSYGMSENPPILHRKETFLAPSHPCFAKFSAITKEGEEAGLYVVTNKIGFKKYWERLIQDKGFLLVEGRLIRSDEAKPNEAESAPLNSPRKRIERHKTAIDRNSLSAPMQSLFRHQYLDGGFSLFDYGCGKGDDLNILNKHGVTATGWDPVYYSDNPVKEADIINLGFVLNVIENPKERQETLRKVYSLAKRFMVASVMLGSEATMSKFEKYGDGVVTTRKTFQKYYGQNEFREYLEKSLGESALAVGPGIFYVFKDKLEEQRFLVERQRSRRNWQKLSYTDHPERLKIKQRALYERHKSLFDEYWQQCLNLGRLPAHTEFEKSEELRTICSSHPKGLDLLTTVHGQEPYSKAAEARRNDLLVHHALSLFGQRKPYKHLPDGLQRDVKHFFGTYTEALKEARELLFSVGKPEVIDRYCEQAYKTLGCGRFVKGHSLTIHRLFVNQLPPALRVYVGCASQLYGDLDTVDLVKIHIRSGKISLMRYDDFEGKPLPLLQERIKIKLREQAIDFFDYGEKFKPKPIYMKSEYLDAEFSNYKKQVQFDNRLKSFEWLDLSGYGPTLEELHYNLLNKANLEIRGYKYFASLTSASTATKHIP